jgi:hypothetical protein
VLAAEASVHDRMNHGSDGAHLAIYERVMRRLRASEVPAEIVRILLREAEDSHPI